MSKTVFCTRCKTEKLASEFAPSHCRGDKGLCRQCNTEYQKQLRHRRSPSLLNKVDIGSLPCSFCGQEKSPDEFRWNSRTGYRPECKDCEKTILRCSNCQEIKPHEDFPPSKKMATGRHSVCHACHSKRLMDKYNSDPEFKAKHKQYSTGEKARDWRRVYYSKPETKKRSKSYRNAYLRARYHSDAWERLKIRARSVLNDWVKRGKIQVPQSCQSNGKYGVSCCEGELEAHHAWGYWPRKAWTTVEWLCKNCHAEADTQQRQEGFRLVYPSDDPVLTEFGQKADKVLRSLGIQDERSLFDAMQDCAGEDECHVFLNVIEWLAKSGYSISKV